MTCCGGNLSVSSFALVVFPKLLPSPELFPKSTSSKLLPKTLNFRHEQESVERVHHELSLLLHYFPPEEEENSEAKEKTVGEPAQPAPAHAENSES
ncbi:hypothetical protein Tco_1100661 [Tanacetum coccineum]